MTLQMVGSRIVRDLPKIRIQPVRYNPTLDFHRPGVWNICGIKDSGKSMLNECFALRHHKIVDLMASRDNESLCWLRDSSPIDDILLVVGDNVDLDCSWDYIPISKLTLKDIQDYECTVTCNSFYHNQEKRFLGVQTMINLFYGRLGFTPGQIIYIIIRESNSFLFSRIKQGVRMKDAKADFIFFSRELRHFGCSTGIDLLRWTGTDKDLRDNSDYIIFKQIGGKKLPSDKAFLYSYFAPVTFSRMKPQNFVLEKKDASLAWGTSPALAFHKEEGVNLLAEIGIKIHLGDEVDTGSPTRLGDKEHVAIVASYLDIGCTSIRKVSQKLHYSTSTITSHLKEHNKSIEDTGTCTKCRRLNAGIYKTPAINPKFKRR